MSLNAAILRYKLHQIADAYNKLYSAVNAPIESSNLSLVKNYSASPEETVTSLLKPINDALDSCENDINKLMVHCQNTLAKVGFRLNLCRESLSKQMVKTPSMLTPSETKLVSKEAAVKANYFIRMFEPRQKSEIDTKVEIENSENIAIIPSESNNLDLPQLHYSSKKRGRPKKHSDPKLCNIQKPKRNIHQRLGRKNSVENTDSRSGIEITVKNSRDPRRFWKKYKNKNIERRTLTFDENNGKTSQEERTSEFWFKCAPASITTESVCQCSMARCYHCGFLNRDGPNIPTHDCLLFQHFRIICPLCRNMTIK